VLIDATVPQHNAFRFFYLLPWDEDRLLVEETLFAAEPTLDREGLRQSVLDYLDEQGYRLAAIERQEQGVLPMPWERWHEGPAAHGPLRLGYRGGFFHPGTGYSFGPAVRLAAAVAAEPLGASTRAAVARQWRIHERQARFARLLNRMLFRGWPSSAWWQVFRWFHRLPDGAISRFYALQMTAADRARIVLGIPPRGLSLRNVLAG
jgi:lycopene beta-cyclase